MERDFRRHRDYGVLARRGRTPPVSRPRRASSGETCGSFMSCNAGCLNHKRRLASRTCSPPLVRQSGIINAVSMPFESSITRRSRNSACPFSITMRSRYSPLEKRNGTPSSIAQACRLPYVRRPAFETSENQLGCSRVYATVATRWRERSCAPPRCPVAGWNEARRFATNDERLPALSRRKGSSS